MDNGPQSEASTETRHGVVVVGAGPGGLAAAAVLRSHGVDTLIVEQVSEVGSSWRARYDNLHLNTVRWLSHLPGLRIPRTAGRWPSRDSFVRYLEDYSQFHQLTVRFETRVERLERRDGYWSVSTSRGEMPADSVVVAIGHHNVPELPDWPGREGFSGELIHSAQYRNPGMYAGRDVLVVGVGDSGSGIALDLVRGGAARVRIAVRTGPNIVHGERFGIPAQILGILTQRLPGGVLDRLSLIVQRRSVGDLSKYGLPCPVVGVYTRSVRDFAGPVVDFGFVDAVKRRRIEVVPAVTDFEGPDVVLQGGTRIQPEAVIAATGFRPAAEPMVGHLGVLSSVGRPIFHGPETHPNAPGLYFVGFRPELGGNLRQMAIDARQTARAVADAKSNGRAS